MMTRNELRETLSRMEDSLAETRRNLMLVEYRLGEMAEAEAIRR